MSLRKRMPLGVMMRKNVGQVLQVVLLLRYIKKHCKKVILLPVQSKMKILQLL